MSLACLSVPEQVWLRASLCECVSSFRVSQECEDLGIAGQDVDAELLGLDLLLETQLAEVGMPELPEYHTVAVQEQHTAA